MVAEFPDYTVDQVTAEVNQRGVPLSRDFVEAVLATTKITRRRRTLDG
ncbi:hypothetical protein [Nonomuraea sp. NPDC023979]